MLEIKDLVVTADEKKILNGVNLTLEEGKTHVLMGPNGSGKSTLAQVLMGHPHYKVTKGSVLFNGKNLLKLSPDERSHAGLFLSFQYPSEVSGVSIPNFLRMIYNKKMNEKLSPVKFRKLLREKMKTLGMDKSFLERYLNEGLSGGEKKKLEMLQLMVLEPSFAILDETDSGLDIDALKEVSKAVEYVKKETGMGVLVITHYTRILNHIKPDHVYVMKSGKIVKSGGKELAEELEDQGYAPFGA
jgi:Fe-S cluster assembly ATP-binding protein